jgi:hypothetical protein
VRTVALPWAVLRFPLLSFVLAAVVVDWGKSDETGVLAPIEPAEFGEVGEDEDGRDEANAGHGTESASGSQ